MDILQRLTVFDSDKFMPQGALMCEFFIILGHFLLCFVVCLSQKPVNRFQID